MLLILMRGEEGLLFLNEIVDENVFWLFDDDFVENVEVNDLFEFD